MTPDDFGSLYFIKLKGEGLNDNSEEPWFRRM